jgi:hypothetical protein
MYFKSMRNCFVFIISMLVLSGCSSGPKLTQEEEDKVLSRIDDLSARPQWLKESEPFRIEEGKVISTGQATIPGENRVEAAYRIAENNAKASIASQIEQRLSFIFQNAEEGTGMDTTQARFIGAEASDLVTSSIRPGKRYWEKVASSSSSDRKVIYRVFATVTIDESDLKRAILDAARKREGKGGISADFKKQVDSHWDKFVNTSDVKGGE